MTQYVQCVHCTMCTLHSEYSYECVISWTRLHTGCKQRGCEFAVCSDASAVVLLFLFYLFFMMLFVKARIANKAEKIRTEKLKPKLKILTVFVQHGVFNITFTFTPHSCLKEKSTHWWENVKKTRLILHKWLSNRASSMPWPKLKVEQLSLHSTTFRTMLSTLIK